MKYIIDREIGRGSFGIVYEAHDDSGNRYAVKAVEAGDSAGADLLHRQFEFLSSLGHRRIVRALDFVSDSSRGPALVMELVEGDDLGTYVETRGIGDLALITAKVLDALRYLHSLGKTHGDLKPSSIIVHHNGGGVEVKLIDVGFDLGRGSNLPTLVGTLPYLAPEIIRSMPADGRSDLYSLGVTLYEVLTGRCPFAGTNAEEILSKHLEYAPASPSTLNPDVGLPWDEFVATLLRKEPFLRYDDAVHAGLELERLSGCSGVFLANMLLPDSIPLVSRDREIASMRRLLAPTASGGMIVCGRRGCGVSRLLREIGGLAKIQHQEVHTVSLDEGMPTFGQLTEALLGDTSTVESVQGLDYASCESEAAYLERVLTILESGLAPGTRHLLTVDRGEVMDEQELRTLGILAARLNDVLSVVVGYQTDEADPGGREEIAAFEKITLDPLDHDALEEMLKRYFGVSAVPADLVEELYEAGRGNPGFTDATVKHLWDCGSLKVSENDGLLGITWDRTLGVPTNLRDVLEAKVAGLSAEALEALHLVCIAAGQIDKAVLEAALAPGQAASSLDELERAGLIQAADGGSSVQLMCKSVSQLVRRAVPIGAVRDAALRLASVVEARPTSGHDCYKLGMLYLEGGKPQTALTYLVRAGDLFSDFSARDALSAYGKALECGVGQQQAQELEDKIGSLRLARGDIAGAVVHLKRAAARPSSQRKLGWVLALEGKTAESVEMLARCQTAASNRGDETEMARTLLDLGYVYSMQSKRQPALKSLRRARNVFRKNDMPREAGQAANRIGLVEMKSANFAGAARAWQEAMADFERSADKRSKAVCLMNLGLCRWKQMDFTGAEQAFGSALSIFDQLRASYERASCYQNYALLVLDRGKLAESRDLAEKALNMYRLLGRTPPIITCTVLLSAIAEEMGNWQDAEKRLGDLLESQYALDSFREALVKRYLAAAKAMHGRSREAFEMIDESYALAREAGDVEGQGQAMLEKSKMLIRFGAFNEALAVARKALTALTFSSSLLLAHEAQRVIGEAQCGCGDTVGGRASLMKAREGFAVICDSLHMARVLRALAVAYFMEGDHDSFAKYLRESIDIFRGAGAMYDYAVAVHLGGVQAVRRGNLLQARHYLVEAARMLSTLGITDLHKKVVDEMERIPSGDVEMKAVTSLSSISETLRSSYDLTTVLNLAMDLAIEYLGADRGVLMLESETGGGLTTLVERKMDKESVEEVVGISESIVGSVRSTGEAVIAADATADPRFKDSKSVRIHNIMSVMCVPLTMDGRLLGIIYVDSRGVPAGFSELERAFVRAFANQVSLAIMNARVFGRLHQDVVDLKRRAAEKYSFEHIVGPGKKMQEVFRQVDMAAKSMITIMLTGESGTGKELVAGLVHQMSERGDKPFVAVDFGAIPRELIESELFGIEKGVATGVAQRAGIFERANGGTLFLDEIGDIPLDAQVTVLRVLAEREFERIGGGRVMKTDVRVICATHRDPQELVRRGLFRADLYHRLNGMRIHIPALRERVEDLAWLVDYFVERYTAMNSKPRMQVSAEAFDVLRAYEWPGNVRELQNCIERAVVLAEGTLIGLAHLPREILESVRTGGIGASLSRSGTTSLKEAVCRLERTLILDALSAAGGVKTEAARHLGLHESTLRKKMKQLGIDGARDSNPEGGS